MRLEWMQNRKWRNEIIHIDYYILHAFNDERQPKDAQFDILHTFWPQKKKQRKYKWCVFWICFAIQQCVCTWYAHIDWIFAQYATTTALLLLLLFISQLSSAFTFTMHSFLDLEWNICTCWNWFSFTSLRFVHQICGTCLRSRKKNAQRWDYTQHERESDIWLQRERKKKPTTAFQELGFYQGEIYELENFLMSPKVHFDKTSAAANGYFWGDAIMLIIFGTKWIIVQFLFGIKTIFCR